MEAVYLLIGFALGVVLCALVVAKRAPLVVHEDVELDTLLRELVDEARVAPPLQTDPDRVWVRFVGRDGHVVAQKRLFKHSIRGVLPWGGVDYAAADSDGDVLVYQAVR